jgi:hypothetical protein
MFAAVLPFRFSLLNLRTRNGNDLCRKLFETLERRFGFGRLGFWHAAILAPEIGLANFPNINDCAGCNQHNQDNDHERENGHLRSHFGLFVHHA